jgi:hypothetical protein
VSVNDVYEQVARIHIACIDQGFLSTLGPRFLSLLYQSIDETENSTLIVARDKDRIIGFVAGTLEIREVYRTLVKHTGGGSSSRCCLRCSASERSAASWR